MRNFIIILLILLLVAIVVVRVKNKKGAVEEIIDENNNGEITNGGLGQNGDNNTINTDNGGNGSNNEEVVDIGDGNGEDLTNNDSFILKPGDYDFQLTHNGIQRFYLLHIPKSYTGQEMDLVLAFHGGAGSAEQMRDNYDLVEKSEKYGFILAFPNGASRQSSGKFATWNAGNCCSYAIESNSDDVGFVKAIVSNLYGKLNIDKVYATGFSNGAMFVHRLACDIPDTISAIAPISGTNNYGNCNPNSQVPIFTYHSLIDQNILYEGGSGPDSIVQVDFVSVQDSTANWVSQNSCNPNPTRVFENNGAYCELYTGCDNNAEVELCVTDDGGHAWPGLTSNSKSSQKLSATDLMWEFFKKHSL